MTTHPSTTRSIPPAAEVSEHAYSIFRGEQGTDAPKMKSGDGTASAAQCAIDRPIMHQSRAMNQLVKMATRYAASSASVMIVGESGTGKELFSRLIHSQSGRRSGNFVSVNCAAIPESLLESELFGHERGAFTGATQKRMGHFEQAHEGTLLLDEISEIPVALQAKLLRVIEEQEVRAVGSQQTRKLDVRIVATSNRDLTTEIKAGRFRNDLYHRLNVLEIQIPPLRERVSDIPGLVVHFAERFRSESLTGVKRITKDAMRKLVEYQWPGNVRELRNVIQRACIITDSDEITVDALPEWKPNDPEDPSAETAGITLAEAERRLILASLNRFGGNKKLAAAELGVTARTLSNKMKLYQEDRPSRSAQPFFPG
jgi:DNA-binding NtrC family response regulator